MDRLKAIAAKHGHLRWQEIAEELGVSTGGAGPVPQPGAAGVGLRSPRRGCGPGGGGVSRGPGPRALQPQSSLPPSRRRAPHATGRPVRVPSPFPPVAGRAREELLWVFETLPWFLPGFAAVPVCRGGDRGLCLEGRSVRGPLF